MMDLAALWLPILLSAVLVFFTSFVLHAMLNWHFDDYAGLPGEDAIADAIRKSGASPGDYVLPKAESRAAMASDAMKKRIAEGPMVLMTIRTPGMPNMGKQLGSWLAYCVVVGIFVAYLTSRTVAADADYLAVFRVAGATAFLAYAGAEPIQSIWFGRRWSTTFKNVLDGLLYALLTAGAFGWLWPS